MVIKHCPRCNQRYLVGFDTNDFIHECDSGNKAIDEEDVVVVGNWEDFSGTGSVTKQQVMIQGAHNELFGRRGDIEGEDLEDVTRRGKRASTHRQRKHLEFIEVTK